MPIEANFVFPDNPNRLLRHTVYPGDEQTIPLIENGEQKIMHVSCGRGDMHGEVYFFDAGEEQSTSDVVDWSTKTEEDGMTLWCGQSFDQRITHVSGEEAVLYIRHIGQFATYLFRN